MKYSKAPLDYSQQIEMLKKRGLLIADEKEATDYLKVISYFRLANYLRPMELDKEKHQYKPNSYFENAIDLYYFDKEQILSLAILYAYFWSFSLSCLLNGKVVSN